MNPWFILNIQIAREIPTEKNQFGIIIFALRNIFRDIFESIGPSAGWETWWVCGTVWFPIETLLFQTEQPPLKDRDFRPGEIRFWSSKPIPITFYTL